MQTGVMTLALGLSACGGGGEDAASGYTLGGQVSGLSQAGLVLANGNSSVAVAAGSTGFAFDVPQSGAYSVEVLTQPAGQTCVLEQAQGSMSGDVSSVQVLCRNYHLYVAHAGSADVLDWVAASDGSLRPSGVAAWATAYTPASLLASSDGQSLWLSYADDNSITPLNLAPSGSVRSAGAPVLAGTFSQSLTLNPQTQTLYVPNYGAGSISQFGVTTGGGLSALKPASVAAGLTPSSVAVSRGGSFAYAANPSSESLSVYTVDSQGALSPSTKPSMATDSWGSKPAALAANPVADVLYLLLRDSAKLVVLHIDPATGALSLVGSQATGSSPRALVVSPNGALVYVLNQGSNTLSGFLASGSTLTPMATRSVPTGSKPVALAISPDGSSLYVAHAGDDTVGAWHIGAAGELQTLGTVNSGGRTPAALAVR